MSVDADDRLETEDPLLKVSAERWGDLSGDLNQEKNTQMRKYYTSD